MSYACRVVEDSGSVPASANPSRMSRIGADSASSPATTTAIAAHARFSTNRDQPFQRVPGARFAFAACFLTLRSMRLPNSASSAGSSVTEASIVTSTTSATDSETDWSEPRPSANSPMSATITTDPANMTERPAVSSATVAAPLRFAPFSSSERYRAKMSSA